jgi:hypothetical protein
VTKYTKHFRQKTKTKTKSKIADKINTAKQSACGAPASTKASTKPRIGDGLQGAGPQKIFSVFVLEHPV